MLKHLFSKDQMHIPDKNLLRRILLDSFDEDFIIAGGRKFIEYLK
jgi:hypothetical protein